jgi:hypothetical protein
MVLAHINAVDGSLFPQPVRTIYFELACFERPVQLDGVSCFSGIRLKRARGRIFRPDGFHDVTRT